PLVDRHRRLLCPPREGYELGDVPHWITFSPAAPRGCSVAGGESDQMRNDPGLRWGRMEEQVMSQCEAIVAELQQEAGPTRKMLERVPAGKAEWKPHAKSR